MTHPAIKSITSTDHQTTRILGTDAEDFINAMASSGDPEMAAFIRARLEALGGSENALRHVAANLTTASRVAGGWLIGRFG